MTALLLSAAISLPALVSEDVLEPSVQNEVDHAISLAPAESWAAVTNAMAAAAAFPAATGQPPVPVSPGCACRCGCASCTCAPAAPAAPIPRPPAPDWFGTNGLSSTAIALKLVSSQQSDGRWRVGTNDVTVTALTILKDL